ncbi:ATP-dependent DNA helicase [Liquorilactobacillus aquaticus DSM 21051]|uniref:ATP-dependent DNA helicase RecQ n=1 Tax=Liquorilactobacillus aquaticus DSM 21051 TaxID=1423725 RepID=A0A0R2CXG3_9LACO|nr:RecQ family ATP-dependent DNA helicase [Liquorilactobacillus aquaticus]KRM96343.1 ATP-dependent DNA helicase [Liquorilactobacillus aquaticus DSM 21051]
MTISDKKLEELLQKHFGFSEFRSGQKDVIHSLLERKSTLAILPTGTGKSLCYQLIGKICKKPVVIISPLISLMQDQVEQLRFAGEKRVVALTSVLPFERKKYVIEHLEHFNFIYLAPEMLNKKEVVEKLMGLDLALLVVDEAHCISKWGPDFRPDYLGLGDLRKKLNSPTTLALTATATKKVEEDIIRILFDRQKIKTIRHSVDRPNIFLAVENVENQKEKNQKLVQLVERLKTPGLIYFSSKKKADEIADLLRQKSKLNVSSYHAGRTAIDRYTVQQQFMRGELDVICATSAFGMGVNKKNIRYVIHYHLPADLESYLQEIGRAGRDGKQSIAILLYQASDVILQRQLINMTLPEDEMIQYYMDNMQRLKGHAGEQGELLDYYCKQGLSSRQVKELFSRRRDEKSKNLNEILAYINTAECRREYIKRYFGEEGSQIHSGLCCQLMGEKLDLAKLGMEETEEVTAESSISSNYQKTIRKLFNL